MFTNKLYYPFPATFYIFRLDLGCTSLTHCYLLLGMFQQNIDYLLVLATSVDVVILGLSFPKGQAGESDTNKPLLFVLLL